MSIGIGDTFRDARRRRGCSLSDAAADTRVRESYLAALEQEEFAGLGGDVYVKGFIASYAKFLHIDPGPLLDTYRTHVAERDVRRPTAQQSGAGGGARLSPLSQRVRPRPVGAIVLLVLLLLVVVVLIALGLTGEGSTASGSGVLVRGSLDG